MTRLSTEELKKRCLRKIETIANSEKDHSTRMSIENTGREICMCLSIHSGEDTGVISRVMKGATSSVPT